MSVIRPGAAAPEGLGVTSARTNAGLFDRARAVIPGGVDSPVRAFRSVGGTPYFVARAQGAHLWDVEGHRYVDYVQSWGASILGHAHPAVVAAITDAAGDGTSFGAPTEREVLLAEVISTAMGSCERVRLVSSGTEAAMTAVRVARGFTGRDRIMAFAGCYHGHADTLLAAGGSGMATLGLPGSAGVSRSAVADTAIVTYNQVPVVGDDVACVIVEPVAANMGLVAPRPGFLSELRQACDDAGALLIFDEVISGFRLGRGGAQAHYRVTPDLTCLGKVVGGGLPLAAVGGRAEVMDVLAPDGPVYQAGTLSGNPLATAAGLAVLEQLDDAAYLQLWGRAAELSAGLTTVFADAGLAVQVPVVGPLVGLFFADDPVVDYDSARATRTSLYAAFFHQMLDRGVALPPSPFEVLFPSLAHTKEDLERTVDLAAAAAAAVAATRV